MLLKNKHAIVYGAGGAVARAFANGLNADVITIPFNQ